MLVDDVKMRGGMLYAQNEHYETNSGSILQNHSSKRPYERIGNAQELWIQ